MASGMVGTAQGAAVRDVPFWLHSILPPIPLLAEWIVLANLGREGHAPYFKGEFAFWELGTAAVAFFACVLALALLFGKNRIEGKKARLLIGLLAFGCFYLAGEEVSWGQHIGGWTAGGVWGDVNYQRETNLHNLKYLSITNQLPRLVVTLFAIFCLYAPAFKDRGSGVEGQSSESERQETRLDRWRRHLMWPTIVCLTPSLLVLLPPVPRMLGGSSLPEPGETAEFYMAVLLAVYVGSMLIRAKRGLNLEAAAVGD